jgi:hypothetical protein
MSQRPSLLTSTQLKERGWTPTLVKKFLDPPDATKPNPHYKSASPMRLYALTRVEAVEVADAFQQAYAKAAARSQVGKTVAARKAAELVSQAEKMQIRVQLQALGKVQDQAIDAYNNFHEELSFERGHEYEPASVMSDPIFLDRITVNYVRHELTEYDESLEEVAGKIGVSLAVATIRRRVYTEIASVYPDLAQECERQVLARLGLGEKTGEL